MFEKFNNFFRFVEKHLFNAILILSFIYVGFLLYMGLITIEMLINRIISFVIFGICLILFFILFFNNQMFHMKEKKVDGVQLEFEQLNLNGLWIFDLC